MTYTLSKTILVYSIHTCREQAYPFGEYLTRDPENFLF